jgi:hypothetical protein
MTIDLDQQEVITFLVKEPQMLAVIAWGKMHQVTANRPGVYAARKYAPDGFTVDFIRWATENDA